jgi:hypothetical protein
LVETYEARLAKLRPPKILMDVESQTPKSGFFKLRLVGGNWSLEIQAWLLRKWG